MWPRVVELMLAIWMLMAPFAVGADVTSGMTWVRAAVPALIVMTVSFASFWGPVRRRPFHLISAATGLAVALAAWIGPRPLPPLEQSELVTGLMLLMFAIIPNEASLPPQKWRRIEATR